MLSFSFEDSVLMEFVFQKIAENPGLAKSASTLRNKLSMVISDFGYSLAEKESGAGRSLHKTPMILNAPPVNKKIDERNIRFLKDLLLAAREKSVCVVSYESLSSDSIKTYKIHPLCLFEQNGGLYAFVFHPYHERIITLAIERIRDLELTEETFLPPEGFDAEKVLSDPFGIIQNNERFVAKIKFDDDQAPHILERAWPEGTFIIENEDGSAVMTIETAGAFELKKWVLGYGFSAEILEPQWLRDEITIEINKMYARYHE